MTPLEEIRHRINHCRARGLSMVIHPEDLGTLEAAIDEAARKAVQEAEQNADKA